MKRLAFIRPFVAVLLLFVFAFAITPKRFLHNLLANHKDTYNKLTNGKTELSSTRTYCQCDNLVTTSPFTGAVEKPIVTPPVSYVSYNQQTVSLNLSPTYIHLLLRGPPALSIF